MHHGVRHQPDPPCRLACHLSLPCGACVNQPCQQKRQERPDWTWARTWSWTWIWRRPREGRRDGCLGPAANGHVYLNSCRVELSAQVLHLVASPVPGSRHVQSSMFACRHLCILHCNLNLPCISQLPYPCGKPLPFPPTWVI